MSYFFEVKVSDLPQHPDTAKALNLKERDCQAPNVRERII